MCCFSRPVDRVSDTNIFARAAREGRQYLAYSMRLSAREDLAMILPIPTPPRSAEDAVRFVNLEKYPKLFEDLVSGFPPPPSRPALGLKGFGGARPDSAPLKVVEVGSFEASFVPGLADFDRLDDRFKLPTAVWKQIGRYDDYGFVVFKLKQGDAKVHPMALEFPRANPRALFFPTVHVHDGKVHDRAQFDHALYMQVADGQAPMFGWEESPQHAGQFVKCDLAQDLVLPDDHVYRRELRGRFKNEDLLV
jgi:hypothetical protein